MRLVWRLALCTAAVVTPVAGIIELPLNHFSVDDARSDGVYIEVGIGTPSERVAVLLDTGSATLAVPSGTVPNKQLCPDFHEEPAQFPVCPGTTTAAMYRDMGMENFGADGMGSGCVIGSYNYNFSTTHSILPATPSAGNNFTQNPYACNTPGSGPGGAHVCQAGVAYGSLASNEACGQGFSGFLGTDTLTLGSAALCPDCGAEISATVSMVMIETIQSGFQEPPCAGIMGIGLAPLNTLNYPPDNTSGFTAQPNALTTLLTANGLDDEFSLCMGTPDSPGVIVLGGSLSKYAASEFMDVPMVTQPDGFYGITVLNVGIINNPTTGWASAHPMPSAATQTALYSEQNNLTNGSFSIVDSGTPQLQLPEGIFDALLYSALDCNIDADCTIEITVQGVDGGNVTLQAPGLMNCTDQYGRRQCGVPSELVYRGGGILGYAVLRNYYTTFRRGLASPTFGFARPSTGVTDSCRHPGLSYGTWVPPSAHATGPTATANPAMTGPTTTANPATGDDDPEVNVQTTPHSTPTGRGGGNVSSVTIVGQSTPAAIATPPPPPTGGGGGGDGFFDGIGGDIKHDEPTNTAGWVAVGVSICVVLCLCAGGCWWFFKRPNTKTRHEYSPYTNSEQGDDAYASGIVYG